MAAVGCTSGGGAPESAGPGAVLGRSSTEFPLPEASAFVPGPCPIHPTVDTDVALQCGRLEVPERHDEPEGAKIELAVLILRSPVDEPAADPIVYLEGGPGGSALVRLDAWLDPVTPLLAERDVILVDQRGTGFSTPSLACDREFERASLFATSISILERCISRLEEEGVDRAAYTTFESARDLQALRQALGIEEWSLYGVSYGTRLALAAMAADPEGTRSVVLDSAYPTGVDAYRSLPANASRAFGAVFTACRADPACDGAYPDLENRFYETIERMDFDPQVITGSHPVTGTDLRFLLDGGGLVSILFDALYVVEIIPDVPKALDAVADGDAQTAFDLLAKPIWPNPAEIEAFQEEALDMSEEGFPSYITDGMHLSVECTEEVPFTDLAAAEADLAALPMALQFALGGSVFFIDEQCRTWGVDRRDIDELSGALAGSPIPTLVLAGDFDPITPPEWGRLVADTLGSATYLPIAGIGHAVIGEGECAATLIASFIDDPEAFDPEVCTIEPPEFTTD